MCKLCVSVHVLECCVASKIHITTNMLFIPYIPGTSNKRPLLLQHVRSVLSLLEYLVISAIMKYVHKLVQQS